MDFNKLYLICNNNKKFDNWTLKFKKKLTGLALDHFSQGWIDVRKGNYLARATFVCYWEIYANNNLAQVSPPVTQATLIHLMHRFLEKERYQEVELIQNMMSNFLRLLSVVDTLGEEE